MVNLKNKWYKAKAIAHDMSEAEYMAYKKMIHDEEYKEKLSYAKEKVHQKYAHKTENMKSGKGLSMMSSASGILDTLSKAGANVQRNLEREQQQRGSPLNDFLDENTQRKRRRY
jgi:hypothetical protein